MKSLKKSLIIFLLLPFVAYSQPSVMEMVRIGDTTQLHVIVTRHGERLVGTVIAMDSQTVRIRQKNMQCADVYASNIKKIKLHASSMEDTIDGRRAVQERVFYFPTAIGMENGIHEYRNVGFFQNSFHRGVGQRLTIGGGIMPIGVLNIGWIDAKMSIQVQDDLYFMVGGTIGAATIWSGNDKKRYTNTSFIGGFTGITIKRNRQLMNFAAIRLNNIDGKQGTWAFSVGGTQPISKRTDFVMEAMGNKYFSYLLPGLRIQVLRSAFEAGLGLYHINRTFALPFFGYAYRF